MTIQDDILKLAKSGAKRVVLADINNRPSIAAKTGVGKPSTGSGGSIASPLTETTATVSGHEVPVRTYYTERTINSTDGLFTLKVKDVKQINFKDANDAEVVFNFADPKFEP